MKKNKRKRYCVYLSEKDFEIFDILRFWYGDSLSKIVRSYLYDTRKYFNDYEWSCIVEKFNQNILKNIVKKFVKRSNYYEKKND